MVNEEKTKYYKNRLKLFVDNPYRIWKIDFWIWIIKSIKWAWQRITKGYCDKDLWDLEDYFLVLFHNTLKEFADNTSSFPAPSHEDLSFVHKVDLEAGDDSLLLQSWKNTLYTIARDCELGSESNNWDYPEDYFREDGEFDKEAMYKDMNTRKEHRNRALEGIKKYFDHLWD